MSNSELGGLFGQMKNIQQSMKLLQEEMEALKVEGSAGGGMVTVTVSGKNELLSVVIDPEIIDKEEAEMLQDLIVAAINQAREKVNQAQSEKMSALTGGMSLPGLNLPF